ncbi:unnamed protein product, partial [Medioppia subpectinata]
MQNKDIVITGMSGRFPMSDTVDEFAHNLYAGRDMITDDESRWPKDLLGINSRMGKIKNFKQFDSSFFGLMENMVDEWDPHGRILLEVVYEAIVDSGVNPQDLRGSQTGVYVGLSLYGMVDGLTEQIEPDLSAANETAMFQTMANMKTLNANRISYAFDFKGPSLIVDTACSASLSAMTLAVNDLLLGHVEGAIVCGAYMMFEPFLYQCQQSLNICSPRGVSAVMDESADGFVKGETVGAVYLRRRADARRIYATVLAARMGVDGNKTVGMFFPSSEAQEALMVRTYTDAGVDPRRLTYFEAHCTGTKAGDTQEVRAIYNAYCQRPGRTDPLPLGVLKDKIGHSEGGSGI